MNREELLLKAPEDLTDEEIEFIVNDMASLDMPDQIDDSVNNKRFGEPKHWRKESLHQIHRNKQINKSRKANKLASKQRKLNRK
jgi:hypothetical protein